MSKKQIISDGYQPQTKGYQPVQKPSGDKVGGYQPTTSEDKPVKPPPKKP